MWLLSECGRYCVRMAASKIPELTQLESGKSMIRNLPAKGTEGLARFSERTLRRVPSPPAIIMATIRTRNLQHMQRLRQEPVHYTIGRRHCHVRNNNILVENVAAWREQRYQTAVASPSPLAQRLRELKAQRQEQHT